MKGCRTCSNWQATEDFLDRIDPATKDQKVQLGFCRRYAPRPVTAESDAGTSRDDSGRDGPEIGCHWPKVGSDDWCGEWDPKFS